jgi:hypothetical protein
VGRGLSSGFFGMNEQTGELKVSQWSDVPLTIQALLPEFAGGTTWKGRHVGIDNTTFIFSIALTGLRWVTPALGNIRPGNFGMRFRAFNHAFDKTFELDFFKMEGGQTSFKEFIHNPEQLKKLVKILRRSD